MVDLLARLPDFCRNSGNVGHTVCRVQDLGVVQASWPSGHWLPLHHQLHLLHRRVPVQRLLHHHLWHRLLLVHLLQGTVKIYHWNFNTQSTTTDKAGQILGRGIIRVLTPGQPWQVCQGKFKVGGVTGNCQCSVCAACKGLAMMINHQDAMVSLLRGPSCGRLVPFNTFPTRQLWVSCFP